MGKVHDRGAELVRSDERRHARLAFVVVGTIVARSAPPFPRGTFPFRRLATASLAGTSTCLGMLMCKKPARRVREAKEKIPPPERVESREFEVELRRLCQRSRDDWRGAERARS